MISADPAYDICANQFAPQEEQENQAAASEGDDDDDIEAQIRKETEDMKSGKDRSKTPFQAVNLDVQCRMSTVSHPSFECFPLISV